VQELRSDSPWQQKFFQQGNSTVTEMIIVAFAVTAFLVGAILGLRFKVFILIVPVIVGIAVITGVGFAFGSSPGFIFFVIFLGLTTLQLGYVSGAAIGCFAEEPRNEPGEVVVPRSYTHSQG